MASIQMIYVGETTRVYPEVSLSGPKTLKQAIASRGIDEKHQIKLWNRRARYAQQQDRPKLWADTPNLHVYVGYWSRNGNRYTPMDAERDLATIRTTDNTSAYVEAWCRLNNLTI